MSLESSAFEASPAFVAQGVPSPRAAARAVADRSVMEMALYTFGDFRTAESWMNTYHPRLNGEPAAACRGQSGQRLVIRLLQAIAHGTEA